MIRTEFDLERGIEQNKILTIEHNCILFVTLIN